MDVKPVRYIVTPEGRLLLPSQCWEVTLEGDEATFQYAVETDTVKYLDTIVRKGFGGKDLTLPEPPADFQYAVEWTDWHKSDADVQVVRYDFCGAGDRNKEDAERIAESTRLWQVRQGLPADARIVCRPLYDWRPLEESE